MNHLSFDFAHFRATGRLGLLPWHFSLKTRLSVRYKLPLSPRTENVTDVVMTLRHTR
jgi:hypothetical protein